MKRNDSLSQDRTLFFGAALLAACSLASAAAIDATARERYLQERAACLSGQSSQPQDVCLREAGAAYAEARWGQPRPVDLDRLTANALARCETLPHEYPEYKAMCERMVRGEGTVTGRVDEGGGVRQLSIIVEAAPMR